MRQPLSRSVGHSATWKNSSAAYGLKRLSNLNVEYRTVDNATGGDRVVVVVSGRFTGAFPFLPWPVNASASVPIERFRP